MPSQYCLDVQAALLLGLERVGLLTTHDAQPCFFHQSADHQPIRANFNPKFPMDWNDERVYRTSSHSVVYLRIFERSLLSPLYTLHTTDF
jgi:hypothetical protein